MGRALTTAIVGMGCAVGVAGCGSSSAPATAPVPRPTLSAARLLQRSERALARSKSLGLGVAVTVRHYPTMHFQEQVRDGAYEVSSQGPDLGVQTRVIGRYVYAQFHAAGDLESDLQSEGRPTVTRWLRVSAPPQIQTLEHESRPSNLAACVLGTRIGRPHFVGQGSIDGIPTNVLRVDQGAAGHLRVTVAAEAPYLPLQVVRTGVHPGPGLWKWVDRYAKVGCGLDSQELRALAKRYHAHLVPVRRAVTTFRQYDEPHAVPLPRRAPVTPLTRSQQHAYNAV